MQLLARKAVFALISSTVAAATASAQWVEDFESYVTGTALEGQGGWHGWDGVDTQHTKVSAVQARSGAHSARVPSGADTVREFDITGGAWVFRGWVYIPAGFTGQQFFIMLNEYNDGGPYEWSVQVRFNGSLDMFQCDCGSATPTAIPLVRDAWSEVRVEIDLGMDSVSIYYDNQLSGTYLWSEGALGGGAFANRHIEAIDLYPAPASFPGPIFWDDLSLLPAGEIGVNYCVTNPNSTGAPADMSASGTTSVSANNVLLKASPVPNQPGLFFYGANQVQIPFGNGNRCVGGFLYRLPLTTGAGNQMTSALDITSPPHASGQITAGSTWNFQAWFRDPAGGGAGFNLSDGYRVTFTP